MRVTVLGKSPSWQDAGGACSGYLVQHGDLTILLDCGNGVFGKLRKHVDYVDVDAVVVTDAEGAGPARDRLFGSDGSVSRRKGWCTGKLGPGWRRPVW